MSDHEIQTVSLTVEVQDCGVAGLWDRELDGNAASVKQSMGIIEVDEGWVTLHITHQWGPADFTVTVADHDPGPDVTVYEDIVEISFVSASGHLELAGFSYDESVMCPLPPLPAGPGPYRIRYHVKGMDLEGTQDAVADHHLQIWPAPLAEPVTVKATTDAFEYFLDPEKFERGLGERGLEERAG
jgi:hypothetical protein